MTAPCIRKTLTGLALGVALACCLGGHAEAQEQFRAATWNRPTASLGLRFGTDDLNLGLGARGGYTIEPGIYIGGMFDYFFGDGEEVAGASFDYSAWMLMAEGGYDFGVMDALVLRPLLGLGVVGASFESCGPTGTCVDGSDTDLELALGGQALYLLDQITLGGEIRGVFGNADALVLGASAGMVF